VTELAICVYCGANPGSDPDFLLAAAELGGALARAGLGVVYGGASIGMMGALADGALAEGGRVTGVVPTFLPDGKVHRGLSRSYVVDSMHERKAKMVELSDAFVVLPGGLGTLDEMFETLTWAQLGLHTKRLVLLNVNGFFDPLLGFLGHVHDRGLVLRGTDELLTVASSTQDAVARLTELLAPRTGV
jgi:[acyl-carrier-protein] S-malonyltransferase